MNREKDIYVTALVAARRAGVSANTVRAWVRRKTIRNAIRHRVGKRLVWMIPVSEVPARLAPRCIFCRKLITGTRYLAKTKYCSGLCRRMHFYYKSSGRPEARKRDRKRDHKREPPSQSRRGD